MNEKLKFEGRLAEKKREKRKLTLKINGLVQSIREILDPFETIDELQTEMAAAQAVELASKHADYLALIQEINAIEKALGY